jgi:hypothetical protein
MVQRLLDSWRNVIASTGISVVLAFCDSQPDLIDSDEQRVQFATQYLDRCRFIYRDCDSDDEKVCYQLIMLVTLNASDDSQKWRGAFRGPFVIKTFAAHLSAIDGYIQVSDLCDKPPSNAVGSSGLTAGLVCVLYPAHLSTIDGCVQTSDLYGTTTSNATPSNAIGALSLAAASVCVLYCATGFF